VYPLINYAIISMKTLLYRFLPTIQEKMIGWVFTLSTLSVGATSQACG
jgi:hypothetical protein